MDASRKAIMLDPTWHGGNYTSPPANGIRLWRDILGFLSARTPEMYRYQFANPLDVLPWLKAQEDTLMNVFDANDYIYQTWAYETHDLGSTAGMNGDLVKALRTIKAKTLMMTGVKDLLNPESGAAGGSPLHSRRAHGHHQSDFDHWPLRGGRIHSRRCGADQRGGGNVPRHRHPAGCQAPVAWLMPVQLAGRPYTVRHRHT